MNNQALIIERPDLQTLTQRFGSMSLTFVFWLLYLYLWLPVISAFAWLTEGYFFYDNLIANEGYVGLEDILIIYAYVVLAMNIAFFAWARINFRRFRGTERRSLVSPVETVQIAQRFHVPAQVVRGWQQSKSMVIYFDHRGEIAPSPGVLKRLERTRRITQVAEREQAVA